MLFGDRDPIDEPGTPTGTPGDWWSTFALVPDVFDHAVAGIAFYRSPKRLLDPKLRELGQTRVGWCVGSRFVYSQHRKACRTVGIGEVERAVLAYTDALSIQHGRVPDGVFSALQKHLSDEEILELTYIVCTYALHGVMSRALRLEYDDDPPVLIEEPGDESSLGDEFTREEFRRALRIVADDD
jgi:alkylhydroperoxidase family enzyme